MAVQKPARHKTTGKAAFQSQKAQQPDSSTRQRGASSPFEDMDKRMKSDIEQATSVMRRGGVILYPTDTIWGIGCDATNEDAVRRVFEIKRRSDTKALSVLVDSPNRMQRYVRNVPDVAWDLIELAEKPLTLILDGAVNLAPNVTAEDGSVGIRVTKETFSNGLCYRMERAIVSTSANISGEPTAHTFAEISDEIKQAVDYICTSRQKEKQPAAASQIIKLGINGEVQIIRQ